MVRTIRRYRSSQLGNTLVYYHRQPFVFSPSLHFLSHREHEHLCRFISQPWTPRRLRHTCRPRPTSDSCRSLTTRTFCSTCPANWSPRTRKRQEEEEEKPGGRSRFFTWSTTSLRAAVVLQVQSQTFINHHLLELRSDTPPLL